MNWHIQQQLRKNFELITPAPIVPRVSKREQFVSRVKRYALRKPSDFYYFSLSTLDGNASRVSSNFSHTDAIFFRSATRWCHCKPTVPYFIYLDIVFYTFFKNTFEQSDFDNSDLSRIFQTEARFLENAAGVFFESKWGMDQARIVYSLKGTHYQAIGRGGLLDPPESDSWKSESLILLSVAMNFEQKGGDIILKAFKELKKKYPDLRWHIVGGRPTGDWESVGGIVYEGLLNPDNDSELVRYRELLSQAFLLIHPTREDANPLVPTEAAYFGCPSVSVNRFAIPELVMNGETGVLLESPVQPEYLARVIDELIADPETYKAMRKQAFDFSREHSNWNQIGGRMAREINSKIG